MSTVQAWGLSALAAAGLIGACVIAATGHAVPAELWTIDTVLVGAVAGVAVPLASTPKA